jgi:GTPase SAR1 family protein
VNPSNPAKFPIILVGNKSDLPNRAVSEEEARQWATANGGYPYIETCALNGTNVAKAFEQMAEKHAGNASSGQQLAMPTSMMGTDGAM